ncbi:MAG: ABC transporter permease [Alphaproteobacteria bacterium]|nr:ABC transporter permease [Alphaproteobacteria bacterium]
MLILDLAAKSLLNRRFTASLAILSIAVSVALLVGVNRLSEGTRASFQSTISGTDLIVGARGSSTQLLLYSVFHIGDATKDMSFAAYEDVAGLPDVAWAVPLALGDSHRGFRVVGTSTDYFEHFRHGGKKRLAFADGAPFADLFDVVIGADVARTLGYRPGDKVVVAHGSGTAAIHDHDTLPFTVTGTLAPTGTPVDRALYVPLDAITAIHVDWQSGRPPRPGEETSADALRTEELPPPRVTAMLLGLKSRMGLFQTQRAINEYEAEPLTAILPGVVITEIWRLIGVAERALTVISGFVVAAGLFGMIGILLTALNERRREIAILRSLGATPAAVLGLFTLESLLFGAAGIVLGYGVLSLASLLLADFVSTRFGLFLPFHWLTATDLKLFAAVLGASGLLGLVPAGIAYRSALTDGLAMRL